MARRLAAAVVHVGSAHDAAAYAKAVASLGGRRPTVLVADPPYCRLIRRRRLGDERDPSPRSRVRKLAADETTLRFEDMRAYSVFTEAWLGTALAHGLQPKAGLVIWSNPLGRKTIIGAALQHGYSLSSEYSWAKPSAVASSSTSSSSSTNETPLRLVESALVFRHSSLPPLAPARRWALPTAVVAPASLHEHPCHKPREVALPLLHAFTEPWDVVLDCFAGSGGLLLAAAEAGREGVGLELLPAWVQRANAALEAQAQAQAHELGSAQ